jgi:hypothetical protein
MHDHIEMDAERLEGKTNSSLEVTVDHEAGLLKLEVPVSFDGSALSTLLNVIGKEPVATYPGRTGIVLEIPIQHRVPDPYRWA